MLRTLLVRFAVVTGTAASLAAFGTAPAVAETIEGEIAHVELHDTPRHIKVRTGGEEVQVQISNRTSVDFGSVDQGYFSEELSSLKPGMRVRVNTDAVDQPARRVSVVSVPDDLRGEAIRTFERGRAGGNADGTEMKVRLIDVNRSRGSFRADFQGTEKTFHADDPKMLAGFRAGEMVTLKVRADDRTSVTDIQSAAVEGRVVEVDRTSGRVHVVVDGREETFKVDRVKGLRIDEGDRVRFVIEHEPDGDRVMTDIEKVSGVGKVR